ncbi:MAG TPA: hypothetical protein PLD62_02450 [Candidatus Cloacimonadota bacterium]|nr:hypothetical protein [Candidatus Cloacimonadota bacterium]
MRKTFIISLILAFWIAQSAALTNWAQFSLNYFTTDAENGIDIVTGASQDADHINTKGKFGAQYRHEISGNLNERISFDVRNNAFFSEKSHELRNSYLYNEIKAKLTYRFQNTYCKVQLNNRYYSPDKTNYLNLSGVEYDTQQQMVNNAIVDFQQDFGKFGFNLFGSFRDLEYKYAVPEDDDDRDHDDEDEYEAKSAADYDLYSLGMLSYRFNDRFSIFARGCYKDDLNDSSELNQNELGGGMEYANRFDFQNALSAEISYYHLDSKVIDEVFTHNIYSEIRYTKRFYFPLTGFISVKNRSVFDAEKSEFLRVSTLLRAHLKFSYLTENLLDSYLLAGGKYNPENNGSLVFGEFNQFLTHNIYLTGGAKLAFDLYSQYSGKLEFYLSPLKSIWLKTEYTDFTKRFGQNIISLGSTLIF